MITDDQIVERCAPVVARVASAVHKRYPYSELEDLESRAWEAVFANRVAVGHADADEAVYRIVFAPVRQYAGQQAAKAVARELYLRDRWWSNAEVDTLVEVVSGVHADRGEPLPHWKRTLHAVGQAIDGLPPKVRDVADLFYSPHGWTGDRIARHLGVSAGTVSRRLDSARRAVRKAIAEKPVDDGHWSDQYTGTANLNPFTYERPLDESGEPITKY